MCSLRLRKKSDDTTRAFNSLCKKHVLYGMAKMNLIAKKYVFRVPDKVQQNQADHINDLAEGLNFWILEVEELFCIKM